MVGDGVMSKDPSKCELFVDTHYIDYMLRHLNQETQCLFEDLKRKMLENTDQIQAGQQTQDRQFKFVQKQMVKTSRQSNRTDKLLTRTLLQKFSHNAK